MSEPDDDRTAVLSTAAAALGLAAFATPPRVLRLAAAERRPVAEADWQGVLIVVAAGELALHCARGGTRTFGPPAVVWFTGLGLVAYSNPGWTPTDLVAIDPARTVSDSAADPCGDGSRRRCSPP